MDFLLIMVIIFTLTNLVIMLILNIESIFDTIRWRKRRDEIEKRLDEDYDKAMKRLNGGEKTDE